MSCKINYKRITIDIEIDLRTRHYIPEDSELHIRRRESLKSYIQNNYLLVQIIYPFFNYCCRHSSLLVEALRGTKMFNVHMLVFEYTRSCSVTNHWSSKYFTRNNMAHNYTLSFFEKFTSFEFVSFPNQEISGHLDKTFMPHLQWNNFLEGIYSTYFVV
jgi:hypothetical protein